MLTHDEKFDVPALKAAVTTPARFIGAMGSSRTTARRRARLIEEGVGEDELARIHAPIGLAIGSRTPAGGGLAARAQIVAATKPVPAPAAGRSGGAPAEDGAAAAAQPLARPRVGHRSGRARPRAAQGPREPCRRRAGR